VTPFKTRAGASFAAVLALLAANAAADLPLPGMTSQAEPETKAEKTSRKETPTPPAASPLVAAAAGGRLAEVNRLLDGGANPNAARGAGSAFVAAAGNGRMDVAKRLLERGEEIGTQEKEFAASRAAENGQLAAVAELVKMGADLSAIKDPAFRDAARDGRLDAVSFFLDQGAAIDMKDEATGATALFAAAQAGKDRVLLLLIKRGANINARDNSGMTPLYKAALEKRTPMVKLLLEHNADVNAADQEGLSLLMRAASTGNFRLARLLVEHGADRWATDPAGRTPSDIARAQGFESLAGYLDPNP
jgi:ankyrin repeat protein